jgi:hypothetical protein
MELSFPPRIKYGVNSSGNPDRKDWIPDQVRNDNIEERQRRQEKEDRELGNRLTISSSF